MTDDKLAAYGQALRVRCRVFLWIAAVGLLGLIVSIVLLPNGGLPPVAQALYRGGSFGVLIAGLAGLLYTCWLRGHPERWKVSRIRETDERAESLRREAAQMAGAGLMFLLAAAGFLLAAVDWRLGVLMECFAAVYFLLYLAAYWWLARKR